MGMSDLNERLNQLEQGALNFLFPRRCPFCNQHIGNKELICAGCEKKLPYTGDRAVRQTSWGRVAAPLYYEDAVRRAILDFKFKGRMGGLPCFGSLTARCAAEEFGGEFDAITWVPVSRKRLRKRGFDQARYLAGSLCVEWHVEPQETLRKILDNPPQSGLEDADARRANVLGPMRPSIRSASPESASCWWTISAPPGPPWGRPPGSCARREPPTCWA